MSILQRTTTGLMPFLVLGWVIAVAPTDALAITYGEPDCDDNSMNLGCDHPNTVSVSGFAPPNADSGGLPIASGRCSGSLLSKDDEKIVILTAGHCVSSYLAELQSNDLIDVGISFDAEIVRDLPAFPVSWSPNQYVLGGIPVLPEVYGPQGLNAFNIQFDYGLIVFPVPPGGLETFGGAPVDLTNIDPVTLPDEDFLTWIADVQDPPLFSAVGYGLGEALNKPKQGGNKGGASPDFSILGVRYQTIEGTAFVGFMGQRQNLVIGSQNPARDFDGTCSGDSGGPIFYDDNGEMLQVAVTSSGDAICRGSAILARTDAAEAQDFLHCALDANTIEQVENCGCTEVDTQGECPK